jgi:hypothetical protein
MAIRFKLPGIQVTADMPAVNLAFPEGPIVQGTSEFLGVDKQYAMDKTTVYQGTPNPKTGTAPGIDGKFVPKGHAPVGRFPLRVHEGKHMHQPSFLHRCFVMADGYCR